MADGLNDEQRIEGMSGGGKHRRIEDCRRLYGKYEGKHHELIEQEMRSLGHADFHRRIMYLRFERNKHRPGWIEQYGFAKGEIENGELRIRQRKPGFFILNSQFSILQPGPRSRPPTSTPSRSG